MLDALGIIQIANGVQQPRCVGRTLEKISGLLIGGEILHRHQYRGGLSPVAGDHDRLVVGGHLIDGGRQVASQIAV